MEEDAKMPRETYMRERKYCARGGGRALCIGCSKPRPLIMILCSCISSMSPEISVLVLHAYVFILKWSTLARTLLIPVPKFLKRTLCKAVSSVLYQFDTRFCFTDAISKTRTWGFQRDGWISIQKTVSQEIVK